MPSIIPLRGIDPRSRALPRLGQHPEDPVDLVDGEMLVGAGRGDDEVGGELDLAEEVRVLARDIELVVHVLLPAHSACLTPSQRPACPTVTANKRPGAKSDPFGSSGVARRRSETPPCRMGPRAVLQNRGYLTAGGRSPPAGPWGPG